MARDSGTSVINMSAWLDPLWRARRGGPSEFDAPFYLPPPLLSSADPCDIGPVFETFFPPPFPPALLKKSFFTPVRSRDSLRSHGRASYFSSFLILFFCSFLLYFSSRLIATFDCSPSFDEWHVWEERRKKRRSIVGENLVYSILAKELIVAKKGVDEGTTDGDRASSLFHHFSPKITESFPARLKYPTLVSSLSIILSQLNDFNRSLKSSQAPGPLVNCSSAALLRYHYVRNNFDVEWDTCFVSIADDATIIEKEKGKEKSRSTLTK